MFVSFRQDLMQFQLNTKSSSYVMQVREGFLLHLYWGAKLSEGDHSWFFREQGRAAFSPQMENGSGFILDDVPLEYPCWGRGDLRTPALEIEHPDGSVVTDLRYEGHTVLQGKPKIPGLPAVYAEDGECETLIVRMRDASGVEADLYYCVMESYDILTRYVCIRNEGSSPVRLRRAMSAAVDFDHIRFRVLGNFGTHCRERHLESVPLAHGRFLLDSRRGASSHVHNPFLILTSPNADETAGDVYAQVLVYSGSFAAEAAANQFDTARTVIGLNPEDFGWTLEAGGTFFTPEAVMTYSGEGLGAMSHRFHRLFRTRLCRGKYRDVRRPVLLNSWEACYFSFDEERLKAIGTCCADLGIELLVIDDGWFGKRDTDNCSLGDWVVDRRKLPNGIEGIYRHLQPLGVGLGIWFEPEMVSPDSDLYRAHPDWCLHVNGRPRSEGRHQLILDLTRPDVRDYLYDAVGDVLKTGMIQYVKWDFNRNATEVGSDLLPPDRQREVGHRYYLGLYELLERLTHDFPDVLFESCSGGGGRFDAGMLYYMPQVWTSDDSDAIERLRIQYGTSMVYPLSAMSAHVSASPNHQTAHVTDFMTRFCVALTGSFGYELDPTALSEEDRKRVAETAALYKEIGSVLASGTYYRLRDPHKETCAAWCTVSEDRSVCVAGYVLTHVRLYGNNERIALRGLDPDALYRDRMTGETRRGDELMSFGLHAPTTLEYRSILWILDKV
ncbi:MAG: alpha-galactosidase [Clostridia bacterium]|nr:alpha-galactosidase [Clostridia bacterium]